MLKFVQDTLVYGIALPALAAGLLSIVASRPWSETDRDGGWGAGCGVALGYLITHWGMAGKPDAMPFVLAGIVVLVLVEALLLPSLLDDGGVARGIKWALRAAAVPAITYVSATFMFGNDWAGFGSVYWPGFITVAALLMLASLERIGERHRGATTPLVAMTIGVDVSALLAQLGTFRMAELIGGGVATMGGVWVASWLSPRLRASRGAATAFTLVVAALSVYGWVRIVDTGDRHMARWGLLAMAIVPHVLLWLGEELLISGNDTFDGWKGTALRAGMVVVGTASVVGGTVALA